MWKLKKDQIKEKYKYLLSELGLKEFYVLGKIEGVFPTFADHVGIQYFVCLFKHLYQVHFIDCPVQGTLQDFHQKVNHLLDNGKDVSRNQRNVIFTEILYSYIEKYKTKPHHLYTENQWFSAND